ncbi:hypothetical protein ACVIGA_005148 [Bradyrhizobium sp. USDA 3240]
MRRNEKTQRPHGVFVVEEGDKAFWTKIGDEFKALSEQAPRGCLT